MGRSPNLSILLVLLLSSLCWAIPSWYLDKRRNFIREEDAMRTGASLTLTAKEDLVNQFLMLYKEAAFSKAVWTDEPYPAGGHFFEVKDQIDNSMIFRIIEKMPKGGVLHVHNHAMTSIHFVIKNITYLPNLYTRFDQQRHYFFSETNPGEDWELLADLRAQAGDVEEFDDNLERELTIFRKDPHEAYPSLNDVWAILNNYFITCGGFWDSDTVNELYFRQALKEFYDDGVQYIEIRSSPWEKNLKLMIDLVNELQQEHPDFIGIKHIAATGREKTREKMESKMDETIRLMKKYPDLVKGFDMVSQEDVSHSQKYFLGQMLDEDNLNFSLPYFFHAGETDWTEGADENLVDAVLLNATRIGHGFAIIRHPKVLEKVRKGELFIELCPISNQVLGLVSDLRNHPGAVHLSNDDPVVIASDDPVVWKAKPLSHDFYMAFMALGSVKDDLRLLKQLAINSFKYSTMTEAEKGEALKVWGRRWDKFIDDVIEEHNIRNVTSASSA